MQFFAPRGISVSKYYPADFNKTQYVGNAVQVSFKQVNNTGQLRLMVIERKAGKMLERVIHLHCVKAGLTEPQPLLFWGIWMC